MRGATITCAVASLALSACPPELCGVAPDGPHLVEIAPPPAGEASAFPYFFTDDYRGHEYEYFRSEGRGIPASLPCGVQYIEKYEQKKLGAPHAELDYFEAQTKVVQRLRNEAPNPSPPGSVRV